VTQMMLFGVERIAKPRYVIDSIEVKIGYAATSNVRVGPKQYPDSARHVPELLSDPVVQEFILF
jgi:hypothetical protein